MQHKITVLTQEDDLDVLLSAFRNGKSINDQIYQDIGRVESQVSRV